MEIKEETEKRHAEGKKRMKGRNEAYRNKEKRKKEKAYRKKEKGGEEDRETIPRAEQPQ
jgi:hypothetical protein